MKITRRDESDPKIGISIQFSSDILDWKLEYECNLASTGSGFPALIVSPS